MPQRTDSGRALFIPHHELKMLPDSIHKTFIFSKDSFINTSLVAEGSGDPGYEIRSTVTPRSTKTRVIRNATDVVTLTRREWPRSNTLAFSGCSEMKMKNWLRDGSFTALWVAACGTNFADPRFLQAKHFRSLSYPICLENWCWAWWAYGKSPFVKTIKCYL